MIIRLARPASISCHFLHLPSPSMEAKWSILLDSAAIVCDLTENCPSGQLP